MLNQITIKSNLASGQVGTAVKSASDPIALLIAGKSKMEVAGNKVFLSGKVQSYPTPH